MLTKRGVLIALEGCDKTGKSTHTRLLCEALRNLQIPNQLITFPDRSTAIGQIIDKYLKCQVDLQDEAIHLLFASNRWELAPKITKLLASGTSVILDRYSFSGVAFTSAKGLDLEWCKNPERGLPKPDRVIYLKVDQAGAANREDSGLERYESIEFQERVREKYNQLRDDSYWQVVDTGREKEEVHQDILRLVLEAMKKSEKEPLDHLWI